MKAFILSFFCLLLMISPFTVHAQTPEPTPIPLRPSSQELQALDSIAAHLETLSASSDTTTNASILILGAGFILMMLVVLIVVVWIARGGLNRIWDIITVERLRASNAEQSETHMRIQYEDKDRQAAEYRTRTAEALERTAAAQERTATTLSNLETKDEAEKRTKAVQDNSNAARDVINTHTEEVVKPIKEAADTTLESVKIIQAKVEKLMTKEEFTEQLRPVQDDISFLRRTIEERLLSPLVPMLGSSPKDDDPSSSAIPGVPLN